MGKPPVSLGTGQHYFECQPECMAGQPPAAVCPDSSQDPKQHWLFERSPAACSLLSSVSRQVQGLDELQPGVTHTNRMGVTTTHCWDESFIVHSITNLTTFNSRSFQPVLDSQVYNKGFCICCHPTNAGIILLPERSHVCSALTSSICFSCLSSEEPPPSPVPGPAVPTALPSLHISTHNAVTALPPPPEDTDPIFLW